MQPVIVDLDGTLIPPPGAEVRFVVWLLQRHRLPWRQAWPWLRFLARYRQRCGIQVLKRNKAWLAGLAADSLAEQAAAFVTQELSLRLRPALRARLEQHRAEGARILLLTGAPELIARPLAVALGGTDCLAARCAASKGRYLPLPPRRHPFGAAKLRLAERWCAQQGLRLADAWCYADAQHDLPLLRACGHPVAVHPDAQLAAVAAELGWPVLLDPAPAPLFHPRFSVRELNIIKINELS